MKKTYDVQIPVLCCTSLYWYCNTATRTGTNNKVLYHHGLRFRDAVSVQHAVRERPVRLRTVLYDMKYDGCTTDHTLHRKEKKIQSKAQP